MRPIEHEGTPPDDSAAIAAEICARLLEWGEGASRGRVTDWLHRLCDLYRADPAALWLYVAWQTGNPVLIAESFEERGAKVALDKQGVHQATTKAFAAIRRVAPELAKAMRETFEAHAPEAKRAVI
jgi:hypothetical protein